MKEPAEATTQIGRRFADTRDQTGLGEKRRPAVVGAIDIRQIAP